MKIEEASSLNLLFMVMWLALQRVFQTILMKLSSYFTFLIFDDRVTTLLPAQNPLELGLAEIRAKNHRILASRRRERFLGPDDYVIKMLVLKMYSLYDKFDREQKQHFLDKLDYIKVLERCKFKNSKRRAPALPTIFEKVGY